jgi:hypothetical protein
MKSINDLIKSFDNSDAHIEKLQDNLIKELNGLPIINMKLSKGRGVFRCRKHKSVNDRFYFESEISYRTDKENIKNLGRCNFFNSSKFYGSISTEDIELGYAISILETSNLLRDSKDGYEFYSIGWWTAKEDIDLFAIKPLDEDKKDSETYKELQREFETHFKNNVNDDQREFYKLIGKEMSKVVKSHENDKYCISALVSEILLQTQVGIVYPSVQSQSKGLNVVFNPSNFDKYFSLKSVLIGDFFKFKQESIFRNLFICEDASTSPFKYKDIDESSYMSLPQVIEFFTNRGISLDHIKSTLLNQTSV